MAKDISTNYPDLLDDRIFWSDIDLDHADLLIRYEEFIANRQYKQASEYIAENGDEVDWFGAYLFNKIELQLKTIGEYLLERDEEYEAPIFWYATNEPSVEERVENMVWIY